MKEKNCRAVQHGTFYLLLTALSLVILILLNLIAEKLPASWTQKSISQTAVLELSEQAETFLRDHRPWGWFETLALADRFQVKRIVVNPGAALSLQSHFHRSEHWIVVEGTARVTVDDRVHLVTENQSVYVPLGAVHRMETPARCPWS